jgi:CspA family cold shock protein
MAAFSFIDPAIDRAKNAKRLEGAVIPMDTEKETGKVKWFNNAKGYGFIERTTGGDVFVHHTAIQMNGFRTLAEGETVSFTVTRGPKGLQAEHVTKAAE